GPPARAVADGSVRSHEHAHRARVELHRRHVRLLPPNAAAGAISEAVAAAAHCCNTERARCVPRIGSAPGRGFLALPGREGRGMYLCTRGNYRLRGFRCRVRALWPRCAVTSLSTAWCPRVATPLDFRVSFAVCESDQWTLTRIAISSTRCAGDSSLGVVSW